MKTTRISDSDIDRYLELAAHHSKPNGMVADGIKIIEQLIRENSRLRRAAAANALYESMEKPFKELRIRYDALQKVARRASMFMCGRIDTSVDTEEAAIWRALSEELQHVVEAEL